MHAFATNQIADILHFSDNIPFFFCTPFKTLVSSNMSKSAFEKRIM